MTARDIVTFRIAEQGRRFPQFDLAPMMTGDLDARDAALAGAIDHAVMRRWLTLATVVGSQLSRPWEEIETKLQAVLLVGAAQLLLLDRLPDHAVINEAVEWAKTNIRPKAGGMVNAVLRKIAALRVEKKATAVFSREMLPLEDGNAWALAAPVFDENPIRRLAQQTSHPESLITHWLNAFGQEKTTSLALHSLVHAPIILHGCKGNSSSALLNPHDEPGFNEFTGNHDELLQYLREQPAAIVQDPTSAAAVHSTVNLQPPPKTIIDVCAGKGTKTRQLAALHPEARIIATDIDGARLSTLRATFAGHDRVLIITHHRLHEFNNEADLLLLDVPCTNTGVLARRVEAKYRFNAQSLQDVVNLQKQLIADSIPLLAERGRLLYSTCSVEAAENEQLTQWITKWHPMKVIHGRSRLPTGLPGEPASKYTDGGYFALLERLPSP